MTGTRKPTRRAKTLALITTVLTVVAAAPTRGQPATPPATRTDATGGVTVTATWMEPRDRLTFRVQLDTHAGNLDRIDLARLATLDDGTTTLKPISWTAPAGSHHRVGTLRFATRAANGTGVYSPDRTYELSIRGIGSTPNRVLRWAPALGAP